MFRSLAACLLLVFTAAPALAQATIDTAAKQAIVIDYDTGTVLLEKNADDKMPTSSMSKVMTAYMIFEALKQGQFSLDQQLMVSEKAWRMEGSKMFIEVGKQISVDDLLHGVIIQSGNDATVVLAEGLSGSEEVFAKNMTQKAHDLGMVNSNFKNASGWPDPDHYSTARDLSILARSLIKEFPEYYKYYAQKEFTYNSIKQGNRNPLLYLNIGADGIKTGHTEAAGYGLIGSGISGDRRVIFVMNGLKDEKERAQEGAKLLDWGLKNFENIKLFKDKQTIVNVPVAMGIAKSVPMVIHEQMAITVPSATAAGIKVTLTYKEPLIAPVQAGQQIGTALVEIPHAKAIEIPVYAEQDIERLGIFAAAIEKAKMLVTGS